MQLRNSRLPFVKFGVKGSHLPQLAALKRGKLAAKIDKFKFKLCQSRADGGQLLAFAEDFLLLRFQPSGDLN